MAAGPAVLLILPAASVPGATELLGLTLARRMELAARRAGFDEVLRPEDPCVKASGRAVLMPADVVATKDGLRALREVPLEAGRLHRIGAALAIELDEPADLLALAGRADAALGLPDPGGLFALRSAAELRAAERWLLASLVKETEGFMSRHVERKISLAVTRRLVKTAMTPNAMTLLSVGVGLAGAGFFLSTRPAYELAGALLFLLHSILDGCDGELARLKFLESRWGGILDFWGDNVVHVAVFLAIAAGWSRAIGAAWPLLLGASAALGTLLSAALVYRETMTGAKDGPLFTSVTRGPGSRLSRLADALARRDFIYLVVILSAFGKAHWFLILSAVGAPAFFAVLLVVSAGSRRLQRRPA